MLTDQCSHLAAPCPWGRDSLVRSLALSLSLSPWLLPSLLPSLYILLEQKKLARTDLHLGYLQYYALFNIKLHV